MNAPQSKIPHPKKRLDIELLALDLNTCSRCTGTAANLRAALASAADWLRELEVEVTFQQTVIESADQAEQLRFASSPTVRINGRDIATESRESSCGDCGELCGCGERTNCRVWVWQGVEHLAAPKALLLDALLKEYGQLSAATTASGLSFRLPENLRAFFAGREKFATNLASCCDQETCCDPTEKSACCGNDTESSVCGCQ